MIGDSRIRLGKPKIHPLRPESTLISSQITITRSQQSVAEGYKMREAVNRQLGGMGIDLTDVEIQLGEPQAIEVQGESRTTWSLGIQGLSAVDSLKILEEGIGGKRHLGCGIFVPGAEQQPSDEESTEEE